MNARFAARDTFLESIRTRTERYLRFTGQSRYGDARMYVKSAVVLASLVIFYVLLVWWADGLAKSVPLAILLGLSMGAVGMNIQHDAGHGAYARRRWVNRLMALSLDLIGMSSFVWRHKHNVLHHTYTNVHGYDRDLDLGPFGRLSPGQKRRFFHRAQHVYLWPLYTFAFLKFQFCDDFLNVACGRIGDRRMRRPRGFELLVFVGGKSLFIFFAIIVPSFFHPLAVVLFHFMVVSATGGLLSSLVNQLAHAVEETQVSEPDGSCEQPVPWSVHQLQTTADWARGNRVLCWLLGGLNFQIEHHLLPGLCHVHYPKLARIVERACSKAGIRYCAFATMWAGLRSHYRWLRRLGNVDNPFAGAPDEAHGATVGVLHEG